MGVIRATHELHARRRGRNLGVGLSLGAFVLVVLGLTIVKLGSGGKIEGFDHTVRQSITVPEGDG